MSVIGNITNTETKRQEFSFPPPPSYTRKRKAPQNTFRSYIDQLTDGYGGAKLVRNEPRKTEDTYFLIKTRKTSVGSYRRNYSHKSVALFRTKKLGSTRANIEYLTCSFLELDGSTDGTIKNKDDVLTLARNNNLLEGLQITETSQGHFHITWDYSRPLPWATKNESYWTAQQKRLIQLFQKDGFNVDKGASLNPCQNLRNPSQLNPYNFKRRCKVHIYKSYRKTSLRAIYRALNATNIPNPKRLPASVKLRRYLRANQTFTLTHKELAINLGVSLRTEKREVKRAIANGDLRIVARTGNNSGQVRTTQYESLIFIEQFPEVPLSIFKDNSLGEANLLEKFKRLGTKKGRRQKTIFALGLFIKHRQGKRASVEVIRAELEGGAMRSNISIREFESTLRNVMKSRYEHSLSLSKLQDWGLLEPERTRKSSLQ